MEDFALEGIAEVDRGGGGDERSSRALVDGGGGEEQNGAEDSSDNGLDDDRDGEVDENCGCTPGSSQPCFVAIKARVAMAISRPVEGILIIWLLDLSASMILEGALATSMKREAEPMVSIIRRR